MSNTEDEPHDELLKFEEDIYTGAFIDGDLQFGHCFDSVE